MLLKRVGIAGTLESSDIMVTIEPGESTQADSITINLQSAVESQFGNQIKAAISDTLKELGVEGAKVTVNDKGALDCTIKARVTAAVYRACEMEKFDWA